MRGFTCQIDEELPDAELEKQIYQGFIEHSQEAVGGDGGMQKFAFVARDQGKFMGAGVRMWKP